MLDESGAVIQKGICDLSEWPYSPLVIPVNNHDDILIDGHYYDFLDAEFKPRNAYDLDTLPLPCTLEIEGKSYYCTEPPTINYPLPGEYVVRVTPDDVIFKVMEFSIHAD